MTLHLMIYMHFENNAHAHFADEAQPLPLSFQSLRSCDVEGKSCNTVTHFESLQKFRQDETDDESSGDDSPATTLPISLPSHLSQTVHTPQSSSAGPSQCSKHLGNRWMSSLTNIPSIPPFQTVSGPVHALPEDALPLDYGRARE